MESFEELLDFYMDEKEIQEKIHIDDLEEIEESVDIKCDISDYEGYAINMSTFVSQYLDMEGEDMSFDRLTHKEFKELMRYNPFVIGISNSYVDIDEIVRNECLIVYDKYGHLGSYLNPKCLLKFLELEEVKKEIDRLSKIRVSLDDLHKLYFDFIFKSQEYEYLNSECNKYYDILRKVKRTRSIGQIKKYIKESGKKK